MGELVTLAGGLTVPVDAFRLVFELFDQGLILRVERDKLRVMGPDGSKPELSAEETERIKCWKWHLIALLEYRAPDPAF